MDIRTEEPRDYDEVFQLNYAAFNNREDESRLVDRIRASGEFIPELSLVAEENGKIAGHALFSKAEVVDDGNRYEALVLAPIAVLPSEQQKGIGGQLIREGAQRARALGYSHIFLIGHPEYYPRFGFKPARRHGFDLKQFNVGDDVFMVLELTEESAGSMKGELRYPQAFFKD